jgi:hypothetical protein
LATADYQEDMYHTIDAFIQRIHDKELDITKNASDIIFSVPSDSRIARIFGKREKTGNLADLLSWAMTAYEETKGNPRLREHYGRECLSYIHKAYAWDVIKEGSGLISKLKKCQEQNAKLEADLADLSAKLLTLQGQYDERKKQDEEFRKHLK